MHNHHEKDRDMARSILPSTARIGARKKRAALHGRERAALRAELHQLRTTAVVDDFEGHLTWMARGELRWMVRDRRGADKVNPFVRWAKQRVNADATLRDRDIEGVLAAFARDLPDGVIGRHAVDHLRRELEWEARMAMGTNRRRRAPGPDVAAELAAILANGLHGELNRRLRAELTARPSHEWVMADHGWRRVSREPGVAPRLLAGAHDVAAFAHEANREAREIVHALVSELR